MNLVLPPALRSRNYQLFFGGQGISLIGTWMTHLATAWTVYALTNSAWMLGLAAFLGQIPSFLLAPFGGVLADHWDRRRALVATQALAMVQSLALAALALTHTVTLPALLGLVLFQGLINALDVPMRQSFVKDMIERPGDLPNAIALNSSLFHASRLMGPALAGLVIAKVGAGWCFFIDGISYIAVIASLLAMRLPRKPRKPRNTAPVRPLARLREGFAYAFGFAPIRDILLLTAMCSLLISSYLTLLPVFATKIFHGGPQTLGLLMGISGVGSLSAAIYMSSRRSVLGLGKVIAYAPILTGTALFAFALAPAIGMAAPFLVCIGMANVLSGAACNTVLQTIVEDEKRGRVMSLYTMAFIGTGPFGSLLTGVLADRIGAPRTLMISGALFVLGALVFARRLPALRLSVRPIYQKAGILPPPLPVDPA